MNRIESFGVGCPVGCATCMTPREAVSRAVDELGLHVRLIHYDDIGEAQERGVTRLPALVIDGEMRSQGRTLSVEEIKDILREFIQDKGGE